MSAHLLAVLTLATTLGQQDPEHSAVYGNDVVHEDVEDDDCYFEDIDMLIRVCPGDPEYY